MRSEPPLLLPLFRSDGQARLLARVYLLPDRPRPLADIARELGLDRGTLSREADKLERAGLVRTERIGRSRILHPAEDSPYFAHLYGLLLSAFGPATVIGPALGRIGGIEQAFVFGSWAARYAGEPGLDPADVDVVAIGEPAQIAVARAERELSERLGRDVNVTVVSQREWDTAETGFLREVRRRPLLPLVLRENQHK